MGRRVRRLQRQERERSCSLARCGASAGRATRYIIFWPTLPPPAPPALAQPSALAQGASAAVQRFLVHTLHLPRNSVVGSRGRRPKWQRQLQAQGASAAACNVVAHSPVRGAQRERRATRFLIFDACCSPVRARCGATRAARSLKLHLNEHLFRAFPLARKEVAVL